MFPTLSISTSLLTAFTAWLLLRLATLIYNAFFHPLRKIRGPFAAKVTDWYKTYIELYIGESWCDHLTLLHRQHGPIIRVGPSELHFSDPQAYFEIYNNLNRWDKEENLYHAFGEDRTSFGYLTYTESKQRKDVLQPLFSHRAIINMQSLIASNINQLADILAANTKAGKSSDIYFALRCFTVDTIMIFCFAKSINALAAPDFKAPIAMAMDASNRAFQLFKHSKPFRWCIFNMPQWLSLRASPETSGLTNLQSILRQQVDDVCNDRSKLEKTSHPTIYHRLLDPDAQDGPGGKGKVPERGSLYEEAQTMIFAGTDTVGNTLYVCFYHIARDQVLQGRLREELRSTWPSLKGDAPTFERLEKLPLLTATIKESLRLSSGVVSPLPRIVPPSGATIHGIFVPGGTNVGVGSTFVHHSDSIFPEPLAFRPERWLGEKAKELERSLVPFSRGPRSCLGTNLAWCEMFYAVGVIVGRFEVTIDDGEKLDVDEKGNLKWKDAFLPWYYGEKVRCWFKPLEE